MLLPDVGAIIFSDDSVLGEKSRWQCTHRKSPENVFFQSDSEFAGFSDPSTWLPDDKPLLHMNMVPGANDDVIFHDMGAFQISIDDQVTVNSLRMSRDWPMTTASFTKFVRTMEGQYQVSLGHTLAKESSEDNVSRMLPLKDPIIILNREKKKTNHYNPNMKNKTLSLICNYVRCHPIGTHCSSTIRPLGHCCDVCGGVMSFSSNAFTAEDIADLIQEIINEDNLFDLVQYSIDRIDDDDIIPRYQVTVLPVKKYDDIVFRVLIMELHNKLSGRKRTMMDYFSVEYEWSALDHSYAQTSKIAGLVTFCILVLAVAAVFWRNNMETDGFTLRGFLFANASSPFRVVWHQGKEDDEDVVQLVNSGEDITSEEEDAYIPSLEVLTPVPMVFQHQAVPLPNKNVSEGLSAIELELIE